MQKSIFGKRKEKEKKKEKEKDKKNTVWRKKILGTENDQSGSSLLVSILEVKEPYHTIFLNFILLNSILFKLNLILGRSRRVLVVFLFVLFPKKQKERPQPQQENISGGPDFLLSCDLVALPSWSGKGMDEEALYFETKEEN